jgi:hypothetical protein
MLMPLWFCLILRCEFGGFGGLSRPLLFSPGFEKREPSRVGEEEAAKKREFVLLVTG